MSIYTLLATLFLSLFFTACMTTPNVPLSPELDQYALVKENCEGLRTTPGIIVPDTLDNECRIFLKRLEKSNGIDYKVAHYNDNVTDPNAKPKPEFLRLQTTAYRQHRKTEVDYETFCKRINEVSLNAIAHNQLDDVALTLTFPETVFTKQHYDYYKKQGSEYQNDPQYLLFEKKYSETLVDEGLIYLGQGDKHGALTKFKEASTLNNAEAEYLVGIIYEAKHVDKAIEWHTKALEHGVESARLNLARLYTRNHQPKKAQKLYIEAAENGDAYAQYLLYKQYKKTDNTKTNKLADDWVKRSAENAFPPAEYAYAKALLQAKKETEAKSWMLKAYQHGISAANNELGTLYYTEKNYTKALDHLRVADSAKAKYQLATMYERGLGVEMNYYRAYMLYREALQLGYKKAKKAIARTAKLKTAKEKAHYSADKRKQKQRQEELAKQKGNGPILRNVRTAGMLIHLQGLVTLPLQDKHGFIINSEKGKQFYVIDPTQQAEVQRYQHVDISAIATGNPVTVSNEEGLTSDIYQFTFRKHCQH